MSALVVNADARDLSFLADESVDLVVTSPPYWAQRSYRDGGEHFGAQIGSEPHPRLWLEAMWECAREWWRVLKPSGSVFVNLGDKRAGSGGGNDNTGLGNPRGDQSNPVDRFSAPRRYQQAHFGRVKSRQLLPERFAIGMEDGLGDPEGVGWIVRGVGPGEVVSPQIWHKANGLPESVTDRWRDDFEYIFHFTKSERYYSAVDEIREPQDGTTHSQGPRDMRSGNGLTHRQGGTDGAGLNPLGKLPGSVWRIASEPLSIPEWAKEKYNLPDHFAAFPSELPRRLILGWSPSAICLRCGEGRRPTVEKSQVRELDGGSSGFSARRDLSEPDSNLRGLNGGQPRTHVEATIVGYTCACTPFTDHPGSGKSPIPSGTSVAGRHETPPNIGQYLQTVGRVGPWREWHLDGWTPPPSRSAVILDPFAGTGTTLGVAQALGRNAVGVELSTDYARLAKWRIGQPSQWAKATARSWQEAQQVLL